jgi:hypothetical protein
MSINAHNDDERRGAPSASSWASYELCHGRWHLEAEARRLGQVAHQDSPWAESGTDQHAVIAGEPDPGLSPSEKANAEFILSRGNDQVERIFGDAQPMELLESRVWIKDSKGKPIISAKFDRCVYTDQVALLQDFKTGFSEPVEAEQNAQLKVQAVAVALNLPSVKEVIVQIISGPYGVTEARYGLPELGQAYVDIMRTYEAMQAPDAPLTPGPIQCKYCPAILICPAVRDQALKPVASVELSKLPLGERAATLLDQVAVVENLIEQVKAYYKQYLEENPDAEIPGYTLAPGAVRREVTDWDTARSRLSEFIDVDALRGAANYRLGDLERALGKALKLKGEAAKERMNQILNGLVETKQGSPVLKRKQSTKKLTQ